MIWLILLDSNIGIIDDYDQCVVLLKDFIIIVLLLLTVLLLLWYWLLLLLTIIIIIEILLLDIIIVYYYWILLLLLLCGYCVCDSITMWTLWQWPILCEDIIMSQWLMWQTRWQPRWKDSILLLIVTDPMCIEWPEILLWRESPILWSQWLRLTSIMNIEY